MPTKSWNAYPKYVTGACLHLSVCPKGGRRTACATRASVSSESYLLCGAGEEH